jgi:hypothetical protein
MVLNGYQLWDDATGGDVLIATNRAKIHRKRTTAMTVALGELVDFSGKANGTPPGFVAQLRMSRGGEFGG